MDRNAPHISDDELAAAIVVSGGTGHLSEQGSIYRAGISAESVRSSALWLGVISLPAGRRTSAHRHQGHETALLMTAGKEIEIWSGPHLNRCQRVVPGDYLFIPAGVPHVAVNRSVEEAQFLVARNDPTANESVIMMPELDGTVP